MADRLSPCVLSPRFALCSFSDYISLPVCVSMCVCGFVCICTQLGSNFRVLPSFERFFVYYTVNHKGFIALLGLVDTDVFVWQASAISVYVNDFVCIGKCCCFMSLFTVCLDLCE